MSKNRLFILLSFLSFILLMSAGQKSDPDKVEFKIPNLWPQPIYDFSRHPLSKRKIELGRKLFYDPILSKDSTISCSSCHLSYTAFTHVDHSLSHGIYDSIGIRNSPALVNLAWNKFFMWDGAMNHIEIQAIAPISSPFEMGESMASVVEKIQRNKKYKSLFLKAFNDSVITSAKILKALSQFQLTIVSSNSKYDKVKRGEDQFSEQETRGYELFISNCSSCHKEPLFTTGDFANNGLPVDTLLNDLGRYKLTDLVKDKYMFKIPSLRNVEYSYPYMHDGRFKTLYQVLSHYSNGIINRENLSDELKNGIELTHTEKVDIVSFLLSLTDKEFLFNKDYAFPR